MWRVAGLLTDSPEDQLGRLNSLGVAGVELRSAFGRTILDLPDCQIQQIRDLLDQYDMQAYALGTDLATMPVDADYSMERVHRAVEVAARLGCKEICGYSFKIPARANPDRFKGEVVERIGQIIEVVSKAQMVYLHENALGYYGDVPTRVLDLAECFTEESFSLVFDPLSYLTCGVHPMEAAYPQVADRVSYVRLQRDLKISPRQRQAYVEDLLEHLREDNFTGVIALDGISDQQGDKERESFAALLQG